MKKWLLIANGLYDVVCAFCTICAPETSIHLTCFIKEEVRQDPMIRRLLAYWIATYGLVRLHAGIAGECYGIAAATYFVECASYGLEMRYSEMIPWKASFVSASCALIGAWMLIY